MSKKAATKPAAKRKPAKKKPVKTVIELAEKDCLKPSSTLRKLLFSGAGVALLVGSFLGGAWSTGGWDIGPKPIVRNDALQQSYDADRITQVSVLRDLAKQPFDGSTADGKMQARDWFNVQRFRNRANDFGPYSDSVAEAINTNSEDKLAAELEAK